MIHNTPMSSPEKTHPTHTVTQPESGPVDSSPDGSAFGRPVVVSSSPPEDTSMRMNYALPDDDIFPTQARLFSRRKISRSISENSGIGYSGSFSHEVPPARVSDKTESENKSSAVHRSLSDNLLCRRQKSKILKDKGAPLSHDTQQDILKKNFKLNLSPLTTPKEQESTQKNIARDELSRELAKISSQISYPHMASLSFPIRPISLTHVNLHASPAPNAYQASTLWQSICDNHITTVVSIAQRFPPYYPNCVDSPDGTDLPLDTGDFLIKQHHSANQKIPDQRLLKRSMSVSKNMLSDLFEIRKFDLNVQKKLSSDSASQPDILTPSAYSVRLIQVINWQDRKAIPLNNLQELVKLTPTSNTHIQCHAGLERTIALIVAKEIQQAVQKEEFEEDEGNNLPARLANIIAKARIARGDSRTLKSIELHNMLLQYAQHLMQEHRIKSTADCFDHQHWPL